AGDLALELLADALLHAVAPHHRVDAPLAGLAGQPEAGAEHVLPHPGAELGGEQPFDGLQPGVVVLDPPASGPPLDLAAVAGAVRGAAPGAAPRPAARRRRGRRAGGRAARAAGGGGGRARRRGRGGWAPGRARRRDGPLRGGGPARPPPLPPSWATRRFDCG